MYLYSTCTTIGALTVSGSTNFAVWNQGEQMSQRGLFEAFVVDPQSGEFDCWTVIAESEGSARLKAVLALKTSDTAAPSLKNADIDDLDIIVRRVGDVRAKAKD